MTPKTSTERASPRPFHPPALSRLKPHLTWTRSLRPGEVHRQLDLLAAHSEKGASTQTVLRAAGISMSMVAVSAFIVWGIVLMLILISAVIFKQLSWTTGMLMLIGTAGFNATLIKIYAFLEQRLGSKLSGQLSERQSE